MFFFFYLLNSTSFKNISWILLILCQMSGELVRCNIFSLSINVVFIMTLLLRSTVLLVWCSHICLYLFLYALPLNCIMENTSRVNVIMSYAYVFLIVYGLRNDSKVFNYFELSLKILSSLFYRWPISFSKVFAKKALLAQLYTFFSNLSKIYWRSDSGLNSIPSV